MEKANNADAWTIDYSKNILGSGLKNIQGQVFYIGIFPCRR